MLDLTKMVINRKPVEFTEQVHKILSAKAQDLLEAYVEDEDLDDFDIDLDDEEDLDESMTSGKHAKINKNAAGEHVVSFYTDGKHHSDSDFYTTDRTKALSKAKNWMNEEFQLDELSDKNGLVSSDKNSKTYSSSHYAKKAIKKANMSYKPTYISKY